MIARLRALLAEATPGPWEPSEDVANRWHVDVVEHPGGDYAPIADIHQRPGDAVLIANMKRALPALLDAAEERDRLAERERHYAEALRVADGGLYQNDWDAAIQRVVAERDAAVARAEQAERERDRLATRLADVLPVRDALAARLAEVERERDAATDGLEAYHGFVEATQLVVCEERDAYRDRLWEVEAVARELLLLVTSWVPTIHRDVIDRARAVLGRESDGE